MWNSLTRLRAFVLILIATVFFSLSCERKKIFHYPNSGSFPEVLPLLMNLKIVNENKGSLDSLFCSDRPKLLIYINGNCSLCVSELKSWKDFLFSKNLNQKLNILFIAESDNPKMLNYIIEDEMDFSLPVAIDNSNMFFQQSRDLNFKEDITLLLDSNNEVVFKGDLRKNIEFPIF